MNTITINQGRRTHHDADYDRVAFAIALEHGESQTVHELQFDIDVKHARYACIDRADAIVVALLPYALRFGYEQIASTLPISERLYYNLTYHVLPQFHSADKGYREVTLSMPTTTQVYGGSAVGAGMSRGVDSFTTLYEYGKDCPLADYRLTTFTFFDVGAFHGMDKLVGRSKYSSKELFEGELQGTKQLAEKLGYDLVVVRTNMQSFFREAFGRVSFDRSHTFRNLSIPLLLQTYFKHYYYSAAHSLDDFVFSLRVDSAEYEKWLLPHLETENVDFYSSNRDWTRFEKIQRIASLDASYDSLQICFVSPHNCGVCSKCKKTIMALDVLGVLDRYAGSFDLSTYRSEHRDLWFSQIYELKRGKGTYEDDYKEIYEYAVAHRFPLIGEPDYQVEYPAHTIARPSSRVRMRALPSRSAEVLCWLDQDVVVTCIGEADGWVNVAYGNRDGWVSKRYLRIREPIPCADSRKVIRACSLMRLPVEQADVVRTLEAGEKVRCILRSGTWLLVKAGGDEGWVPKDCLRAGKGGLRVVRFLTRAVKRGKH